LPIVYAAVISRTSSAKEIEEIGKNWGKNWGQTLNCELCSNAAIG